MERDKSIKDIIHGESVGFSNLKPADYWDAYEALRIGCFTGQYELPMPEVGLIGDLQLSAVRPEPIPLSPEQEHLLRPTQEELRMQKRIL